MKVICTVSHRKPLPGGGFRDFIAGHEYDTDGPDPEYSRQPDAAVTIHAMDAGSFEQYVNDNPHDVVSPKRRK